jgi:hypothetical protein
VPRRWSIDETVRSPVLPIAIGFVVAIVVILAAFFQDILLAAAARVAAVADGVARPIARLAAGAGRRAAAGLGSALRRPRPRRPSTPDAGTRGRGDAGTWGRGGPVGSAGGPETRARPVGQARRDEAVALGEPAAGGSGRELAARAPKPALELEQPFEAASEEAALEPTATAADEAPAERPGRRNRLYRPTSSLHVAETARQFLSGRGGTASVDAMVRQLDREFGEGLGVGILEGLRRRGVVALQRDADRPTRMLVTLTATAAESTDG